MTWFYVIHGLLQQKRALEAPIHEAVFLSVAINSKVNLALQNIEDEAFLKTIYIFL